MNAPTPVATTAFSNTKPARPALGLRPTIADVLLLCSVWLIVLVRLAAAGSF